MTARQPISGPELQQLKAFWQEEDDRNGGMSDMTRCILEIERLRAELLWARRGFFEIDETETLKGRVGEFSQQRALCGMERIDELFPPV